MNAREIKDLLLEKAGLKKKKVNYLTVDEMAEVVKKGHREWKK